MASGRRFGLNGEPRDERTPASDPLEDEREERAGRSLRAYCLDLDDRVARGEELTEKDLSALTTRQVLQMLANEDMGEAQRHKCLELLTSLRAKKLVPKAEAGEVPSGPDVRLPS